MAKKSTKKAPKAKDQVEGGEPETDETDADDVADESGEPTDEEIKQALAVVNSAAVSATQGGDRDRGAGLANAHKVLSKALGVEEE